ncbi:hypothetical protein [Roseovarius sp. Pro17]|uniref:hypothetical protein n=1 Tax=Roseovarius sp. Pro17 TaxID=3108175 RepID=UPI002D796E16|nr:hypothetical protein [Roseovarius sp. Pro17]
MRSNAALALALLTLMPAPLTAQEGLARPLSAIDWLDQGTGDVLFSPAPPSISEPPVAGRVSIPNVDVTPLAAATSGAVGLLPPSVTGLPPDLWAKSDAGKLVRLWRGARQQPSPAIAALYHTLLLAEAEPPHGAPDAYLRTRVQMLRRFGAVEPALELLARAGPETPALFASWFDLALLAGAETEACTALRDAPGLMANDAAQIYCTALTGDWRTAALLYDTGTALGTIKGTEGALLGQFLDSELAEAAALPPPSAEPTPLEFRLFEAIGSPLPTRSLPLAFAMADLRSTAGWKAEIEAAERLTRAGALAPNRLMGLYTRQRPSASGGVWDRVAAVQDLEAALDASNLGGTGVALNVAWQQMRDEGLEVPFAQLFAEKLQAAGVPPRQRDLAFSMALLTPAYEAAADKAPDGRNARFLASLAQGRPNAALANGPIESIIASAFTTPPEAAPEHAYLIDQGKLGEAILSAALQFDRADGDPGEMASALGTMRAVGLEDSARRAALQTLVLGDGA